MRLAWLTQLKTRSFVRTGVVFTGVVIAGSSLCLNPASAEIAWREQLTTAHAEAKAQNKPLLLHFYSDNCVWCDRLDAGAFQSPELGAAVAQGFVPVKIHAGKSPELAKMFNVTKFPTDVVVTAGGQTLAHSVSPQDPSRYIAMLGQAQSQSVATPSAAPGMPPMGQPGAGNLGGVQTKLASATLGPQPSASPQMPVNSAGSFGMQQVPGMMLPQGGPMAQSMPQGGAGMFNPHVTAPQTARNSGMMMPGGATASLAGVRTDGMSLGMPGQLMNETPEMTAPANDEPANEASETAAGSQSTPKLAMEGYCAVTVIDEDKWVEGNPKFGVIHLGKLYLFSSAAKMQTFLKDPEPYTPVLNEIDVVRFFEERQVVQGKRRFGMRDPVHQRMFFFADEAAMNHFFNDYLRYTDAAIEVMSRAVADANPVSK